jgi:hypothetical protein
MVFGWVKHTNLGSNGKRDNHYTTEDDIPDSTSLLIKREKNISYFSLYNSDLKGIRDYSGHVI